MSEPAHLSRKEAADFLRRSGYPISHRTLARLASSKKGPPYVRFLHRIVSYERAALLQWAESQSERGGGAADMTTPPQVSLGRRF